MSEEYALTAKAWDVVLNTLVLNAGDVQNKAKDPARVNCERFNIQRRQRRRIQSVYCFVFCVCVLIFFLIYFAQNRNNCVLWC